MRRTVPGRAYIMSGTDPSNTGPGADSHPPCLWRTRLGRCTGCDRLAALHLLPPPRERDRRHPAGPSKSRSSERAKGRADFERGGGTVGVSIYRVEREEGWCAGGVGVGRRVSVVLASGETVSPSAQEPGTSRDRG